MMIFVRQEQPAKALSPILVTVAGITVFPHPQRSVLLSVWIIALQFSRESYILLLSATTMLLRLEQPENAPLAICVTDDGMNILVRQEQPSKAFTPTIFTDEGIMMLESLEQPEKIPLGICVNVDGMMIFVRLEQPAKASSPI